MIVMGHSTIQEAVDTLPDCSIVTDEDFRLVAGVIEWWFKSLGVPLKKNCVTFDRAMGHIDVALPNGETFVFFPVSSHAR